MAAHRMTTAEVASRLGVKPETVYAYVSRGQLTRRRDPGGSTFDPAEVERLARSGRRAAAGLEGRPMAWVTELTLIEDGRLWYRGEEAVSLPGRHSFEEVAEWLWTGGWTAPAWQVPLGQRAVVDAVLATLPADARPLDRFTVAVAAAATADPLRHDLSPAGAAAVGRQVITLLADDLGGGSGSIAQRALPGVCGLAATPARCAAVEAALILLADHELAASTLAARTAAAFGADPYAVIGAGLGAASGARHAGASGEVESMLDDAGRLGAAVAVGERLRRGRRVPGHGQRLYPDGDPRGRALVGMLGGLDVDPARLAVVEAISAAVAGRDIPPFNVDFGLGALAYVLEAPPGSGEALFVLARVAGWLAHAAEQYADPSGFRVRATYTGPRPGATG